jgi:hypothetical protein
MNAHTCVNVDESDANNQVFAPKIHELTYAHNAVTLKNDPQILIANWRNDYTSSETPVDVYNSCIIGCANGMKIQPSH